jgi:hypothetical protein
LVNLQLAIFDHAPPPVGYHFRSEPNHPLWESLIKEENDCVRKLNDTAIDTRFKIVPIEDDSLVIMSSAQMKSGGRKAIRTASVLYKTGGEPVRWLEGLCSIVRQALESATIGGEMKFDLNPGSWPKGLLNHPLPRRDQADKDSKKGAAVKEVVGFTNDEIMNIWSYLPPDERITTEVIIGHVSEADHLSKGMKERWIQEMALEINLSNLGSAKIRSPMNVEGLENLHQASLLADSTGFLGDDWVEVISSEMARHKGSGASDGALYDIRLKLAHRDANVRRRTLWRELAIEMLHTQFGVRYPPFLEVLEPLAESEIAHFHSSEQSEAIEIFMTSKKFPFFEVIELLSSYVGVVSEGAWGRFFRTVEFNTLFLKENRAYSDQFLTKVFGQLAVLEDCLDLIAAGDEDSSLETRTQFVAWMLRAKYPLRLEQFSPSFLKQLLRIDISDGSLFRPNPVPLCLAVDKVLSLQWDDPRPVVKVLAKLHSSILNTSEMVDTLDKMEDFWLSSGRSGEARLKRLFQSRVESHSLWRLYLDELERIFTGRGRLPDEHLAFRVAPEMTTDSWWYKQTIFQFFEGKKVRSLLRGSGVEVADLAPEFLEKLHRASPPPKLIGWPSPVHSIYPSDRPQLSARLSIQPRFFDRLNRIAGLTSILVFPALTLMFVLLVASSQNWVNVPDWVFWWNNSMEGRGVFCLITAFTAMLLKEYRDKIKELRNP